MQQLNKYHRSLYTTLIKQAKENITNSSFKMKIHGKLYTSWGLSKSHQSLTFIYKLRNLTHFAQRGQKYFAGIINQLL